MERYNFQVIEKKWQKEFSKKKLYREKIYFDFVLRYALHHGAKRESDVKIV